MATFGSIFGKRFSLSVGGRAGPLPVKPPPDPHTPLPDKWGWRSYIFWPSLLIALYLLDRHLDRGGEIPLLHDVAHLIPPAMLGLGAAILVYVLILCAGRIAWGIQRLHDLDRPALDILPDALWMLVTGWPFFALAYGVLLDFSAEPAAEIVLIAGSVGIALWTLPVGMAFWSRHLKHWHETVETQHGHPGHNKYGPPPSLGPEAG